MEEETRSEKKKKHSPGGTQDDSACSEALKIGGTRKTGERYGSGGGGNWIGEARGRRKQWWVAG